jgi:hypothetical protein
MVLKTGATFLVDHALREAREHAIDGSCFKFVLSRYNKLLQKVRRTPLYGQPNWKPTYHPLREDHLCNQLEANLDNCHHPEAFIIFSDVRPRQAYSMGKFGRATRRIVELYLVGTLMGRPNMCRNCNIRHATQAHVMECTRVQGIDALIRSGKLGLAKKEIVEAIRQCSPEKAEMYDKMRDLG